MTWGEIGKVHLIRGSALVDDTPLIKGDSLHEGDQITTLKESLVILKMNDQTTLTLGAESKLTLAKYSNPNESRDNLIKLLRGQMRALIEKRTSPDEKIRFDTQLISVGVRGTEFLTNAYFVGNAPSTDTLLLEGSLEVTGTGFEPFTLKEGEYFNSQEIVKMRSDAIKEANPQELEMLKTRKENFFPELQTPEGFRPLLLAIPLAISGLPKLDLIPEDSEKESKQVSLTSASENQKEFEQDKRPAPKEGFSYNLKLEPWDIRDAVLQSKMNPKNKDKGKCYYFFYKRLPGSGKPERFRRERECNEF